jgi:hypothetical protein
VTPTLAGRSESPGADQAPGLSSSALVTTTPAPPRLELSADFDNVASRRIAIRNGFREVGVRDGRVLHVLEAGE